jgi:hypothetical protein
MLAAVASGAAVGPVPSLHAMKSASAISFGICLTFIGILLLRGEPPVVVLLERENGEDWLNGLGGSGIRRAYPQPPRASHGLVQRERAGREKCEAMAPVGLREFSTAREVPAVTTLR